MENKTYTIKCPECGTDIEVSRPAIINVQNNPEYKVMVGTTGAMGVSVTLTAATNVIFFDDCWTPADKEQACDRCYRIGTTKSVNVYTLLAKNTIDEYVYKILEDGERYANEVANAKLLEVQKAFKLR